MEITIDKGLRHWWVFLIRGILFILLGLYMVATPANSFAALGFLFGLIILFAGISELFRVVRDRDAFSRGFHLFIGVIDIILGIVLLGHIAASETLLRIILGIWILLKAIGLFSFGGSLGKSWPVIAAGIILVIFGGMVLFNPVFGAVTIIIWIAFAFMIIGMMNILLSFRMKSLQ
jgi:uncharacterized membrane protein HdeD (DUF308 family)